VGKGFSAPGIVVENGLEDKTIIQLLSIWVSWFKSRQEHAPDGAVAGLKLRQRPHDRAPLVGESHAVLGSSSMLLWNSSLVIDRKEVVDGHDAPPA
jgi:hypothetical protein